MNKVVHLEDLAKLMIEYGLVIRAIPYEKTSIFEVQHQDDYPSSTVYYDDNYKREMIRVTEKNPKGGKFIITKTSGQGTMVNFWGKPVIFYDTIEEAVQSFLQ